MPWYRLASLNSRQRSTKSAFAIIRNLRWLPTDAANGVQVFHFAFALSAMGTVSRSLRDLTMSCVVALYASNLPHLSIAGAASPFFGAVVCAIIKPPDLRRWFVRTE